MKKLSDLIKNTIIIKRFCHSSSDDLKSIRNLGILAHIDAGKTTTTERMLFYSGKIQAMGEVHRGNTVTDFLNEERERGITISSAAVSFPWKEHVFNLIDTPGHIDFTIEVERSLNVLDGAVVILDGTAGVEAQTLTVWRQADRYNLPRIIYLNKMDRPNASLERCLDSIRTKLSIEPITLHIPVYDQSQQLKGIVDVVTMTCNQWEKGNGRFFEAESISPVENKETWDIVMDMKTELVEKLADNDNFIAEEIIRKESLNVSTNVILQSMRNVTIAQKMFPVVCGSSYKNIGVQLLMDAVINFLPSPADRNEQIFHCFNENLCARAFKVIHDSQRKPVTFFRVYTGSLKKGQKIFNIQQNKTEQISKLMIPYADETIEVPEVSCGNIAAVSGLKETVTGDFITSSAKIATHAKKILTAGKGELIQDNFGQSTKVPIPVFYCAIEAPSQAYQTQLETALVHLQKEDPSLCVVQDEMTSQTVLGGMGELHLDIIKKRIITDYKINVELGKLQIAYQEIPQEVDIQETHVLNHKIGASVQNVTIVMSLLNRTDVEKDFLLLDRSPESAENIAAISPRYLAAIEQGVDRAFSHGPMLSCPVVNSCMKLHWCEITRGTSEHIVGAAASQCVHKLLKTAGTRLLEPVMILEVVIDKDTSSSVLSDLARRRGVVQKVTPRGQQGVIDVLVPLAELLGYAADLRKITSGNGSFTMELDSYQPMSLAEEAKAVKSVTGFDP